MQEKLIRNKQLTNEQTQTLKNFPQFLQINQSQFVLYNLVQKQSNSGLFKNQRLLILDIVNESLFYISKIPQGLIPFQKYEEVRNQQPKEFILQKQILEDNINKFSCQKLTEKNGIEIKLNKKDKKIQWIYYFANKDLMNQWYSYLSFLFLRARQEIDAYYHSVPQPPNSDSESVKEIDKNKTKSLKNSQVGQNSNSKNLSDSNQKSLAEKISVKKPQMNEKIQIELYKSGIQMENIVKQSNPGIHNKQEIQSEFKEFEEHTPLGIFLRQQVQEVQKEINQNEQPKQLQGKQQSGQEYIKKTRERLIDNQNNLDEEVKSKKIEDLSILQYQAVSISLQPQTKILLTKTYHSKQKQWNQLYQQSSKKTQIYFDFVSESIRNSISLIDKIAQHQNNSQPRSNGLIKELINGIEYIICFKHTNDQELLYESSQDQPIVYNLYQDFEHVRRGFYKIKQQFDEQEDSPQLAVLIQYKLVPVLCIAQSSIILQSDCKQAINNMHFQDQLFCKMQQGQLNVVSTLDFRMYMRKNNIPSLNWSYLYYKANNNYFRSLFLAQIFCQISLNMLRSQLFHIYTNFCLDEELSQKTDINRILASCALHLIERLMTQTKISQQLWTTLRRECQRVFHIQARREQVNQNYLSFAILQNSGLHNLNQKPKTNNKLLPLITYWSKTNQFEVAFKPIVHCLNYQKMTQTMRDISEIIDRKQYSRHMQLLDLRGQIQKSIPQQINYLIYEINLALSATVSYKVQFGAEIFEITNTQEPSNYNYLTSLSKMRQLLYEGCEKEAVQLASSKIEQITFYVGKSPLLAQIYQTFCQYQIKYNQFQKVISNIKRQIQILNQSIGVNCQLVLIKRAQLSDLYYDMNRRDECIREMNLCKKICQDNNNTDSKLYKNILLRLSKIALNMGKYNDCVNNNLTILKIMQKQKESDIPNQAQGKVIQFLKVLEALSRAFQLSKRHDEQLEVVRLAVQRCKKNDYSVRVVRKLLKITLFPFIKKLPLLESQMLLDIVNKIVQTNAYLHMNGNQLFLLIRSRELIIQLQRKISELQGLKMLYDKITKNRVLENLNSFIGDIEQITGKGQFYDFTVDWALITKLVSPNFIKSLIKDSYYQ